MEQNPVSDEELIERINQVLNESKQDRNNFVAEIRQKDSGEKFHDVCETTEEQNVINCSGETGVFCPEKNLVLENHYLSLQLQAEKKKSRELQSKFKLFENSVKYFERLNGQLETIKRAVDEDSLDIDKTEGQYSEAMQKIRPKTIHTAASGIVATVQEEGGSGASNFSEPHATVIKNKEKEEKEEVSFRDAEDFKQLEEGLEIVKDKNETDCEVEKVFITKKEKRCLEDIGNLASRTRAPIDDKHQKFFERDRRKFANSIAMPDVQEVDKADAVPPEIISKTKETPVNITSTELDGLRSYLLQLKELIARRETAWARTTERDYNQRVEITRFKNEVSHLRMLCEKRQKDIKERDQIIADKDEEIKELQKRIQSLRSALSKFEKKEEKPIDNIVNEALENSHLVQRSYNAMKRQPVIGRSLGSNMSILGGRQTSNSLNFRTSSRNKETSDKKTKNLSKKVKGSESTGNEDDVKSCGDKSHLRLLEKDKQRVRHRNDSLVHKTKETYEKVDSKLHRVEEMLHNEVLKGAKKNFAHSKTNKKQVDIQSLLKNQVFDKAPNEYNSSSIKKLTPSNSTIRQEMLTAITGLNTNPSSGLRNPNFQDLKKNNTTAAALANAFLAARNPNVFIY